jgi:hypothetical protein
MTRSSARTAASCRRTARNGRSPSRRARTRPGPRRAGSPEHCQEDWEAIELRSDLARHLDRTAFPAARAHLLETLAAHQAEQRLLDLVSSLPDGATFASLGELLGALGLPMEERPA